MKVITGVITPLTARPENPSKPEAPAGWRRGYAADCKALRFSFENNPEALASCADKARTIPESDKRPSPALGTPRPSPDGLCTWVPNDYRDLRDRILGEGAE